MEAHHIIASGKSEKNLTILGIAYFDLMATLSKIKSKSAKPEHAWFKPSLLMNLTYLGLSSGLSLDLS
jgi:hypothetical protein